ncbi:MAG: Nucleotide-binding protein UspA family [Candidatus Methanohalarchaeum thermophilum]|uniref:Nucleotide-binding protein UspA family n=1 Tax=Methanohalarchaeum thermophilum TaxID=1903181 RepID=A0A1Q6DWD7_METT1|nr:MAG: Nucleotide-binding protein UspA family [Candidatus Methanohalarchaeum thermophilum]
MGCEEAKMSWGVEKILLPTDGSSNSMHSISYAVDLAQKYDSDLHLLHVIETNSYKGVLPYPEGESLKNRINDNLRARGNEILKDMAKEIEDPSIEIKKVLREGTPSKEILDYIDENKIDIVVMSTHGRTGTSKFLMGSVAEKVVRKSNSPVLTINTKEEKLNK